MNNLFDELEARFVILESKIEQKKISINDSYHQQKELLLENF